MSRLSEGLLPGQRGAWAEALAVSWLIGQGYEVFIGFSGQESCDAVAYRRDGNPAEFLRVEVKYARRTPYGRLHVNVKDPSLYDMLLVVTLEGEILCDPTELECTGVSGPGCGRGKHPRKPTKVPA